MNPKEQVLSSNRLSRMLPLREGGVFSWRFLSIISLVGCIMIDILFNILPIDQNTLMLYWFYPAALLLFAQLYFNLRFTKHMEIRLLLAYLGWMCLTVVLNRSRAHLVESNQWFACACTTLFLCFSLPYAFSKEMARRVMTALAIATVLAVALLSIVSLIAVYAPDIAAKFPSVFEGINFVEGRLAIDTHPNRSAPAQAVAIILIGYLLATSKKSWMRVVWILCGILCFIPLALTVSRTAIIGTGIAVGFEVFVALREVLRKKTHLLVRLLICTLAACASLAAVYKGADLVGQVNNSYLARIEASAAQVEAIAPTAQPAVSESVPAPTAEPAVSQGALQPAANDDTASEVVSRDLSDADSFNGRTGIWMGVWNGLLQNPKILAFGTGPASASAVMSPYFPIDSPTGLFHNSLLGVLVSFGVVGLLFTLVFLVLVALFSIKLTFGKNTQPLAMRLLPAILLFTFAEGMMEDFLFAYESLNISWIWFMIAAGFIACAIKQEPTADHQEVKE